MLFLLATVGVVALAPPASATARMPEDTLRLEAVYLELEQRSPLLRVTSASARAAAARVGPTTRLPDPELQLATMNRQLSGFGLDPVLGMNQVTVMQMVALGGRIGLSADAARARAREAAQRVPETRLFLRAQAAQRFFALYRIDRSVTVISETRELVRRLAGATQSMYAVGEGRQADVLRAQVEVARMTEELIRMGAMRSSESGRLNGLLDRSPTDTVPAVALPDLEAPLPRSDSLIALALAARPMLRAADEAVAAAKAEERRAGRELWPDLTVGATYGQRRIEGETDRMVSLMVGASIPLWAGRRQKQMQMEMRAMREMAEADLAAQQAETRASVTEVVADLDRTARLITLYRGTVLPQASATFGSSLSAYQVGSVDFMTVLDNQMTVNRYRLELINLLAERGTMLAELEMLTGQQFLPSGGEGKAGGAP